MASAERIFHLMDLKKAVSTGIIPPHIDGKIEFQGVSFSYEKNHPVLHNLTFTVRPGETLAIVGATGAGKSTIINLIERFHAPDEGAILLDGVNLQQLSSEWLRKMIGFVPQDLFIIAGTIRENIVLDLEVSDEDLDGILDLSQMSSVVKNLPNGLQTRIGEGFDLSRGQQQLMSLARVLARNPKILILDEATANVDSETEMLIDQALENVMSQRTCILIAHRLSTVRRADRILVMDRGKIVESGSHDGLMAEKGHYFHLQRLLNITE
jgi:ABC-type multidrug transport system fused ATPase/permease subunit